MKRNHTILFAAILLAVLLLNVQCVVTRLDQAELREDITAANEKFMTAFSAGDAAGMAALYTEDGKLMPPNSDFVSGQEAIQGFWRAIIDMGVKGAKLEILEVEGYGKTAIEVSTYTMLGEEEQVLDKGKYIVIWKKVEGEWKLHHDIFNSSMPL